MGQFGQNGECWFLATLLLDLLGAAMKLVQMSQAASMGLQERPRQYSGDSMDEVLFPDPTLVGSIRFSIAWSLLSASQLRDDLCECSSITIVVLAIPSSVFVTPYKLAGHCWYQANKAWWVKRSCKCTKPLLA